MNVSVQNHAYLSTIESACKSNLLNNCFGFDQILCPNLSKIVLLMYSTGQKQHKSHKSLDKPYLLIIFRLWIEKALDSDVASWFMILESKGGARHDDRP